MALPSDLVGLVEELIRVEDRFYILATSSRVDDRTRVLKNGDAFAVFDRYGNIHPVGIGEQGLYYDGTRHLSRLDVSFGGQQPLLLSSTVREDNAALAVDLANPDLSPDGLGMLPADTVHLLRTAYLWKGALYVRILVRSFARHAISIPVSIALAADFVDVFEVRGVTRAARGTLREPVLGPDRLLLAYDGLDGLRRKTRLKFSPAPRTVSPTHVEWRLELAPRAETAVCLVAACEPRALDTGPASYEEAFAESRRAASAVRAEDPRVVAANEQFNAWITRSVADLHMMITQTPAGPYPYAGIPWFSTIFGRDGIITALQTLWFNPGIARGVLRTLATTQARDVVPEHDAEPGKILHEMRGGEMAALGEIPFGRYYGSVDATPLFVMLAAAYHRRTGDRAFSEGIWENVERALGWIAGPGDPDGDGFLEYRGRAPNGLSNQGWKDSHDSVFHADGGDAETPIALCEVQGYAYAAQRLGAQLARELGQPERAAELDERAEALRRRFEDAFWVDSLSTYALALDGAKAPCAVRASNAGHALYAGIASPERAALVARTLLTADFYSGWGIRTVATTEARYNPMSYHNGSVWPHDNALIAAGFARYGLKDAAMRVLTGLFEASLFVELRRLPELFCGFVRRPGEGPTLYPVACSPQAWAVGSLFMLLEACLGLSIDAIAGQVTLSRPMLPDFLSELVLEDLHVGDARLSVMLRGHGEDVAASVVRRTGRVELLVRS
jgi:glycogen debranching enzyme